VIIGSDRDTYQLKVVQVIKGNQTKQSSNRDAAIVKFKNKSVSRIEVLRDGENIVLAGFDGINQLLESYYVFVKQYQVLVRDQKDNTKDLYKIKNAAAKEPKVGAGNLNILVRKDDLNTVIDYRTKAKITSGGGNTQA
jgi:hypothetical protein